MSETSKFLEKFFKIQRLKEMRYSDIERWARLEDWVRKGDTSLDKDVRDYAKLIVQNGNAFDVANLDSKDLDDEDWTKLFYSFQRSFLNLADKRDKQDSDTQEYIDEHKDFFDKHGQAEKKARVETLEQIGNTTPATGLLQYLKEHVNEIVIEGYDISKIIDGIQKNKFDKSEVFQKKLQSFIYALNNYQIENQSLPNLPQVDYIVSDKGWDKSGTPSNLKEFKQKCLQDNGFLTPLYKKSKIRDAFKKYEDEDSEISASINSAEKKIDKEKIPPKREDQLSFPQQIQKLSSDTYEGYLEKYVKFKGDRIHLNPESKDICKAIDKAKFKPTDGLDDLISKSGDISKRLNVTNNARLAFEWLTSSLKEFQSDPQMSKAFKGALKNGWQMKHLIRELIIKATKEAKENPKDKNDIIKKAKISMEVLSIIKYGNTTSKIMDTLREDESFKTLFSNEKLSWNKNEGVKFVMSALDKTIHTAFLGIGYGITIGVNTIRKAGSKFNGEFGKDKTGAAMKDEHGKFINDTEQKHRDAEDKKTEIDQNLRDKRAARSNALNNLGLADDENLKANLENKEKEADEAEYKAQKKYNEWQEKYDAANQKASEFDAQLEQRKSITDRIASIGELLKDTSLEEEEKNHLLHQRAELRQQLQGMPSEDEINKERANLNLTYLRMAMNNAKSQYDVTHEDKNNRKEKLDAYKNANSEVKIWENKQKANEEKLNNWGQENIDVYKELMSYWDFLETGRDSHTGPLYDWSLGNAKNKKNTDALAKLQRFQQNYGMAA